MKTGKKLDDRVNVKIRIEPALKAKVEEIFDHYKLSTSQAINLFLHSVAESKSLNFNLKMPNEITQKVLDESRQGINVSSNASVRELFEEIEEELEQENQQALELGKKERGTSC